MIPLSFFLCLIIGLSCEPEPPSPVDWFDLPAIVSVYDPSIGGVNCDDDCSVTADGTKIAPNLYGTVAACDPRLLGSTVTFPGIGSFRCIDTGSAIGERWSKYFDRRVVVFDLMVDLSAGVPNWSYSLWFDWSIDWN